MKHYCAINICVYFYRVNTLPKALQSKLSKRKEDNSLRTLAHISANHSFSSNDYLGIASSSTIFQEAFNQVKKKGATFNGASGSRLLSGNSESVLRLENNIATFFNSESAILYTSGYAANVGLLSAVIQREDIVVYDAFCHASLREGLQLSRAKTYKFKHNDLQDLEQVLLRVNDDTKTIYVVTESVFSMDGDSPNIETLNSIVKKFAVRLIIDEAHAVGVFGTYGEGMINTEVFAKVVTFGKAFGCQGAAVLGNNELIQYLQNFSKPFIYTTALPPQTLATLEVCLAGFLDDNSKLQQERKKLHQNIILFKEYSTTLGISHFFIESNSAIQCCIVQGNNKVKEIASLLYQSQFLVRAILSPTVKKGEERLRFCIRSVHTSSEIKMVLDCLSKALK